VPGEEIIVPCTTPQAGPAARQARPATTTRAPRRLGLVLAVIATAQLMVTLLALDRATRRAAPDSAGVVS
jgi:hypothetical protein